MSDLQNQTPANTYKGLLQVGDYTDGITNNTGSNALQVTDGAGVNTALALSTARVGVGNTSPQAELDVSGGIEATTLNTSGAVTGGSVSTSGAVTAGSVVATSGSLNLVGTDTEMFAASNGDDIQFKFNGGKKASINNAGLFAAGDGSNVVPSFRFTDDLDTGMFRPANNEIAFSTASNEAMRIDSAGNVGIGTSPDAKLHLSTTGTDGLRLGVNSQNYYHMIRPEGDSLYLGADDGGTGGPGADIRFNVKGDEKMRIDTDGKVGIGTLSPSAPLEVVSTTGGVIMPRMNDLQRDAISSPTDGEMIFNTSTNTLNVYNGTAWRALTDTAV